MSDESGPAFPATVRNWNDSLSNFEQRGMSLRDWFAGQALAGMLPGLTHWKEHGIIRHQPADCAQIAYVFADAMLAARKGSSSEGEK